VTIHSNLRPSAQCVKAAATTARTVLVQIARTFHFRDGTTFVKLYKTYVRPHLEFSTPAWSPWTQTDKDCIEKVQMKMVKMVSGLTARDYKDRLIELGLESLGEQRHQADM
jgi:ribonucleases P/MRP protein subunit RPP40